MGTSEQILQNLIEIRGRIADAAARSGRSADDVTLVAVTKYLPVGDDAILALAEAGCRDLGESRPQHLAPKVETWNGPPVRWHMIGHLQRNKIRKILPLVELIHSADSLRLIEAIDRIAGEEGVHPRLLLEVNISGDPAKHGFSPDELPAAIDECRSLHHVNIGGLMGMSGLHGDEADARREFASLRELRDRLAVSSPDAVSLDVLSMGMSGDFEAAVEEGATHVRVGSALYEER